MKDIQKMTHDTDISRNSLLLTTEVAAPRREGKKSTSLTLRLLTE